MIWIIAGGRNYRDTQEDYDWLDELAAELGPPDEVLHGGTTGADAMGHAWGRTREYKVTEFAANWPAHGKAAGPIRNRKMAAHARDNGGGACILFPGGGGTVNMKAAAEAAGLRIIERLL